MKEVIQGILIPSMEQSASLGKLAFLPAAVGGGVGIFFHWLCYYDGFRCGIRIVKR